MTSGTTSDATTIRVEGAAPYDVVVGNGLADRVPDLVLGARTVAVAYPGSIAQLVEPVTSVLAAARHSVVMIPVPDGEPAKALDVVAGLWEGFGRAEMTRSDAVVAVGGGATSDVVGFAAATWLRGIRVVHVPTTLLGMVDAAVGGKTGINTTAGKNLVGAFHPPVGVLVDLDVLDTLPETEWINGMAEVVKAGFIADPGILDLIEEDIAAAARPKGPHTRELIERSIRMKADVVSQDLREAGQREILNYGHTLGHAIERVEDFRWPHGHAISVGMVFAATLSRLASRLDRPTADRHRRILAALGLPTRYRGDAWDELHQVMRVDKKARGDRLRFVVLDGLAKPRILEAPDDRLLTDAYKEVSE